MVVFPGWSFRFWSDTIPKILERLVFGCLPMAQVTGCGGTKWSTATAKVTDRDPSLRGPILGIDQSNIN